MTLARKPERVAELREKGRAIAAYFRANPRCFQEQAALAAGVSRKTFYAWLNGEDEACEAFQAEVLPALYERALDDEERAMRDIGSAENGSGAWASWHKWWLAQRHRKIFGDLAQKVELSGPEGGPMRTETVVMTRAEALAELKRLREVDPEAAAAIAGEDEDER